MSNDALSTFLSSSLNVELVFIILQSITTFSTGQSSNIKTQTSDGKPTPQQVEPIIFYKENPALTDSQVAVQNGLQNELVLEQIQIEDLEQWDTKAPDDFVQKKQDREFDAKSLQESLRAMNEKVGVNSQTGASEEEPRKQQPRTLVIDEQVTITEYAPAIFQAVKNMDGVTNAQVGLSLAAEFNKNQVFKAKESAGKSGSFFFFSFDKKFLIKTMNNSELAVFRSALPKYLAFLRRNPNSLIARIYGIFTVRMEDIVPVHLLLMANSAQAGKNIENVFDLKGSIINREVKA